MNFCCKTPAYLRLGSWPQVKTSVYYRWCAPSRNSHFDATRCFQQNPRCEKVHTVNLLSRNIIQYPTMFGFLILCAYTKLKSIKISSTSASLLGASPPLNSPPVNFIGRVGRGAGGGYLVLLLLDVPYLQVRRGFPYHPLPVYHSTAVFVHRLARHTGCGNICYRYTQNILSPCE